MSVSFTHKLLLGWGKIRRAYLVHLRKDYVTQQLSQRQGECQRCGACCRLMFNCWLISSHNGDAVCRRYLARSQVCHIFPIDERDIKDRNLVKPEIKCGFSFNHTSDKGKEKYTD